MNFRKVFALVACSAVLSGIAAASAGPASATDCQVICTFGFGLPSSTGTGASEVGLKFQTDSPGWVAAVCFWQTADESGNHTVSLWDSSGAQLATAVGITQPGELNCISFNPVPIAVNTTYTVSYTTHSSFALQHREFLFVDATSGQLHAGLNAGVTGAPGAAPTSANGDGYGVDVGFLSTLSNQTTDCPATLTAPTKPTSVPGNPGTAVVSWAPATSDPDGCIVGYVVTPYLNGDPQPSTVVNGTGTTTIVKDLTLGQTYTFTIAAESGIRIGPQSVATGPVTIGTPLPAQAMRVSRLSRGTLGVSFKAPRHNGAAVKSYTATCKAPAGTTGAKSGKSSPLRVTRLTPGQKYRCIVRANNRYGSGPPTSRSVAVKA